VKPYYDHDGITLHHGRAEDVLPTLEDGAVDLVLTDPPYGIGYAGSQSVGGSPGRAKAFWRTWKTSWDEVKISSDTILKVATLAPLAIIWGGQFYADVLPISGGWLIWDKTQREMSFGDGEMAWTNALKSMRIFSLNRVFVTKDGKQHPTQKPLALMTWCLKLAKVEPGALILDPFAGSGTTLRAAKDAGLRAIGVEINEAYCEIAARRLEQGVLTFGE
jgi:site-specific DNA-methyltransferase (adenine-specific)